MEMTYITSKGKKGVSIEIPGVKFFNYINCDCCEENVNEAVLVGEEGRSVKLCGNCIAKIAYRMGEGRQKTG